MAILVGIDEAGFGPLLGPLVVSSCSFAVADSIVEADLWQLLKKNVPMYLWSSVDGTITDGRWNSVDG